MHQKPLPVCYLYPNAWRAPQPALLCRPLVSSFVLTRLNWCKKLDLAPRLTTGFVVWLSLEQNFECRITSVKPSWSPIATSCCRRVNICSPTTGNPTCSWTRSFDILSPSIFTGCFWLGLWYFSRICSGFPLAMLRHWLVAVVCCLCWGTHGSTSLAFPSACCGDPARCLAHPSLQPIKSDGALWQKIPWPSVLLFFLSLLYYVNKTHFFPKEWESTLPKFPLSAPVHGVCGPSSRCKNRPSERNCSHAAVQWIREECFVWFVFCGLFSLSFWPHLKWNSCTSSIPLGWAISRYNRGL